MPVLVGGGAVLGSGLGAIDGYRRGNTAEGLGRGLVRGSAIGVGGGLGGSLGAHLATKVDNPLAQLGLVGGGLLAGGLGGNYLAGKLMTAPAGKRKDEENMRGWQWKAFMQEVEKRDMTTPDVLRTIRRIRARTKTGSDADGMSSLVAHLLVPAFEPSSGYWHGKSAQKTAGLAGSALNFGRKLLGAAPKSVAAARPARLSPATFMPTQPPPLPPGYAVRPGMTARAGTPPPLPRRTGGSAPAAAETATFTRSREVVGGQRSAALNAGG